MTLSICWRVTGHNSVRSTSTTKEELKDNSTPIPTGEISSTTTLLSPLKSSSFFRTILTRKASRKSRRTLMLQINTSYQKIKKFSTLRNSKGGLDLSRTCRESSWWCSWTSSMRHLKRKDVFSPIWVWSVTNMAALTLITLFRSYSEPFKRSKNSRNKLHRITSNLLKDQMIGKVQTVKLYRNLTLLQNMRMIWSHLTSFSLFRLSKSKKKNWLTRYCVQC